MKNSLLLTNDYPPVPGGISTVFYHIWKYFPEDRMPVLTPRVDGAEVFDRSAWGILDAQPALCTRVVKGARLFPPSGFSPAQVQTAYSRNEPQGQGFFGLQTQCPSFRERAMTFLRRSRLGGILFSLRCIERGICCICLEPGLLPTP